MDSPGFLGITYQGKDAARGAGTSVANAGDVNADGKPDLLVGAEGAEGVPGRVFVILGGRGGPLLKRELPGPSSGESVITFLTGSAGQDHFGAFVAGAGDVDQDGIDDFLIGAPASGNPLFSGGGVFLVFGDPHLSGDHDFLRDSSRVVLLAMAEPRGLLGVAGAGVGDVNADGFDDIALGVPAGLTGPDGGPLQRTGKVIVVAGGPGLRHGESVLLLDRPGAPPTIEIPGFELESELGRSVAPAGDFDGDGTSDLALGAPALRGDGAVFVIFGRAGLVGPINLSATDGSTAVELRPSFEHARFGEAISGGLDATGDGGPDLLIGAPEMEREGVPAGGAALVPGGPRFRNVGLVSAPGPTGVLFRGAIESRAGAAVALVPDLKRQGEAEALIGAPNTSGGRGAAYINFNASPGGTVFLDQLDRDRQVVFKIGAQQARLGASVAGLPDRNGDLLGDFALGAPGLSTRELPGAGAVFEINVPADPESPSPRNLKASLLSGGRVRLTWTIANVYRSLRVYRDGVPIDGQLPGHLQQFTDVSPGKGKHVYVVEANADPGLRSNLAEIEVRGIPVRELNCRQVENLLRVRVSWTVSDKYDSLAVTLDGVHVAEVGPGTTSYELEASIGVHSIEVFDPQGALESERARCVVEVKRGQIPDIDGFSCTIEALNSVRLRWEPSPAYLSYALKRNGIPIVKLPRDASTYLDVGVPSGPQRYEILGLNAEFHPGPASVCETVVGVAGGAVLRGRVEWLGDGPVRSGRVRVFDAASGESLGASAQVNDLGRFEANVQKRASYRVDYEGHLDAAVLDCTIPVPFERIEVSSTANSLDEDVVLQLPPPLFLVAAPGAESPEQGPAARWRALRAELDDEVFHFALVLPSGVARGAHFLAQGIEEIRDYLRAELGSAPSFVDLVAYGSAGLSARAYVAGTAAEPVRRLVLIGTPNLGTIRGHLEARAELAGRPIRLPGDAGAGDCQIGLEAFTFSSAAEQTSEFLEEFNSKVTFLRGAKTHLIAGTGGLRVLDPVLRCTSHDNRVCESSALGGVPGATLHTIPEDHEMLGRGASSLALLQAILTAGGGGGEVEGNSPALEGGAGGAESSHPPGDVYAGVLEPGGQGNFPMISDTSESIIIILNTDQPGGIDFRVGTPAGKVIDPPAAGALEGVEYQTYGDGEGHIVQAYKFEPCELGTYVALLENPTGGEPLQYSLESYLESGLAFEVAAEPGEIDLSQVATILARLTRNGQPEVGSTVEARVWRPDGDLVIVALSDDGLGADQAAGDGVYSASVPSDGQPGIHEVELSATSSIGPITLYRREGTTRFQVRSDLIAFSGGLTAEAGDDNADHVLDYIHVDGEVISTASGVFLVTGKLVDSAGGLVAEGGTLFGLSGPQSASFRIYFSGSDIFAAHRNGPFTLREIRLLDGTAGFVEADRRTDALVTAALGWDSFGIAPATQRFVRADSNGDSRVDISDAVAVLDYLFSGTQGLACLDAADADASGGIGITDAILVLDFLFAGKGQIAQPFPICGSGEILGCDSFAACD